MAENLPANMVAARARNEAAAAAQNTPQTTDVTKPQPTLEFGQSIPSVVNETSAGVVTPSPVTSVPTTTAQQLAKSQEGMTAEQFAAANQSQSTVGDLYAKGVRNQEVVGSFQNVGDQGTGGTSQSTTGTGTTTPTGTQTTTAPETTAATATTGGQIVNDMGTSKETVSQIMEAAKSFGGKLDSFMGSFKGDMGEFLNTQTNAYKSMMDDMKGWMDTTTGEMKTLSERYTANLDRYAKAFEAERDAGIAEANKNAEKLTNFALIDKDMALKQNQLAQEQSAASYRDQIDMASENQARYLGFLTSKFQAAGMANGSAGLQLIGKYLAAGQMSINALARDNTNAQMMYLAKGTEIMNNFSKQAFQIEVQRQTETRQLRTETDSKLLEIEKDKFASEEKKLMNTYAIVKDYNAAKADLMSKSFNEVMSVKNQMLQEAQFAHGVLQDEIKNTQWQKSFDRGIVESDRTFGLQEKQENRALDAQRTNETGNLYINGKDTGIRALPGLNYDQNVKEFERAGRQWQQTFNQGKYEFEKNYGLNADQAEREKAKFLMDADEKGWEVPNSSYKAAFDKNGELTLDLPKNANGEYKTLPGREQCGAFVNDVLGLTGKNRMGDSIEQKKSLIDSNVPVAGGAFVQELSGKFAKNGHTGVVTKVYPDGSFDFVNANANGKGNGSITTGHMTLEQAKAKGIVGFTKGNPKMPRMNGPFLPQDKYPIHVGEKPASTPEKQIKFGDTTLTKRTTTQAEINPMLDRLTIGMSKDQRKVAQDTYNAYVKNGREEDAKQFIDTLAYQNLPAPDKTKFNEFSDIKEEMGRIARQYKDTNVKGGVYAKLANDNRKWADLEQDPAYRDFFADVQQAQAAYRKSLFGASVTETEMKSGAQFLIDPSDQTKDVLGKVEQMKKFAERTTQRALERAKGSDTSSSSATQSFTVNGRTYNVPADQVAEFKKDMNI